MLGSMILYAALVLIVYGAALSHADKSFDILSIAAGLLWVLIVFTSLIGLNRSFAYEKENNCLDALLLAPIDRSLIFLAKATSNLLFLLIVEIIVIPLFAFFFLQDQTFAQEAPFALLVFAFGTIGCTGIGTFLSTITANTRGRDVMLAALMIPLTFPLLYACVSATNVCLTGGYDFSSSFIPALTIICVYDIVMSLLSWVLYDFVVST